MRVPLAYPSSSLDFALQPPDPGQRALDARVRAMSPAERAEVAYRMRLDALILVNRAADAAGPMSELDRATFILRRLYPEYGEPQLEDIRRELARRQEAGRWNGFVRPTEGAGGSGAVPITGRERG